MSREFLLLGFMAPMFLCAWEISEVTLSNGKTKYVNWAETEEAIRCNFGEIFDGYGLNPMAHSTLLCEIEVEVIRALFAYKVIEMNEIKKIVLQFCKDNSFFSIKAKMWADRIIQCIEKRITEAHKEIQPKITTSEMLVVLSQAEEVIYNLPPARTAGYRGAVVMGPQPLVQDIFL